MTSIDFAAQFGGRDAAAAVLPHFQALKAAAKNASIAGFPTRKFGFVLRVDGEVTEYGLSGAGNVEYDKKNGTVSVDIGVTLKDRKRMADRNPEFVCEALLDSIGKIATSPLEIRSAIDLEALETAIGEISARYKTLLTQ